MILCSSVINYAYMDPKQREFHGLCLKQPTYLTNVTKVIDLVSVWE